MAGFLPFGFSGNQGNYPFQTNFAQSQFSQRRLKPQKRLFSKTFKLPNSSTKVMVRERYFQPCICLSRPASSASGRAEYIGLNEVEFADFVENYSQIKAAVVDCRQVCFDFFKKNQGQMQGLGNLNLPMGYVFDEQVEESEDLAPSSLHKVVKRNIAKNNIEAETAVFALDNDDVSDHHSEDDDTLEVPQIEKRKKILRRQARVKKSHSTSPPPPRSRSNSI